MVMKVAMKVMAMILRKCDSDDSHRLGGDDDMPYTLSENDGHLGENEVADNESENDDE